MPNEPFFAATKPAPPAPSVYIMPCGYGGALSLLCEYCCRSAELPRLELDVITPHFADYYQKKKWPTDSQNPIPIPFLTVAPNTAFLFAVGWRGTMDEEAHRLRELAQTWLINGLEILGAGAKTSAGYGIFAAGALLAEEEEPEAAPELAVDADEVRITQLIQQIEVIPSNKVAGEIHAYYEQWRNFDGREELKECLAIAICKRVESSSFRKNANKRKKWYQELLLSKEQIREVRMIYF